jgi:hypothetical protein
VEGGRGELNILEEGKEEKQTHLEHLPAFRREVLEVLEKLLLRTRLGPRTGVGAELGVILVADEANLRETEERTSQSFVAAKATGEDDAHDVDESAGADGEGLMRR